VPTEAPLHPLAVVGVGADGWGGLSSSARSALQSADVVIGAPRQLAYLDDSVPGDRLLYPTPLLPQLSALITRHRAKRVALLASGDPMFYGIGRTVIRLYGAHLVQIHTHPSSLSLAAARLGWALEDVEVVSLVGRPIQTLYPLVQPGRRALVLVAEPDAASSVRAAIAQLGYPASRFTVLSRLGGADERVTSATDAHDPLAILAIDFVADASTVPLPRTPGLPDDAFDHDGQITKREIRALTLAALAPVPGQLLWDVGSGSGSIAIEWMRTHPASTAIAIEPRADRRQRIVANASALGVPSLQVLDGAAPAALAGLPAPDAVFVGGGVSVAGVIDACINALGIGGRIVANAVTVETETVLAGWYARRGGTLTRLSIQRAEPVGGFTGWRAAMPVTQWSYRKDAM
jgi:precorrin-6Y C5,15-methyltransferase (decarboxylating)